MPTIKACIPWHVHVASLNAGGSQLKVKGDFTGYALRTGENQSPVWRFLWRRYFISSDDRIIDARRYSPQSAAPHPSLCRALRWRNFWRVPRENAAAGYECGHDCPENHQWHDLHCHCGVLRRLTPLRGIIRRAAYQVLRNVSGSLAMFAAIRRASWHVGLFFRFSGNN